MIPLILIIVSAIGFIVGGIAQLIFLPSSSADPLGSLLGLIYGIMTMMIGGFHLVILMILWSFKRFRAKLLMKPYHVEFVNYPNELYRVEILGSPSTFDLNTKTYIIGALLHGKYGFHNHDDSVPIDMTLDMPWSMAKVFDSDFAYTMIHDESLIRVEQSRRRIPIGGALLGFGLVIVILMQAADLAFGFSLRDLVIQGFNILIQTPVEPPPLGEGIIPPIGGA